MYIHKRCRVFWSSWNMHTWYCRFFLSNEKQHRGQKSTAVTRVVSVLLLNRVTFSKLGDTVCTHGAAAVSDGSGQEMSCFKFVWKCWWEKSCVKWFIWDFDSVLGEMSFNIFRPTLCRILRTNGHFHFRNRASILGDNTHLLRHGAATPVVLTRQRSDNNNNGGKDLSSLVQPVPVKPCNDPDGINVGEELSGSLKKGIQ